MRDITGAGLELGTASTLRLSILIVFKVMPLIPSASSLSCYAQSQLFRARVFGQRMRGKAMEVEICRQEAEKTT